MAASVDGSEVVRGVSRTGGMLGKVPVSRPGANFELSVRPRTSVKLRESFDTLGGAAILKIGGDYIFDADAADKHRFDFKWSLCEKWFSARLGYHRGEVNLEKTYLLDGRTRVALWVAMKLPFATPSVGFRITPFGALRRPSATDATRKKETQAVSFFPPLRFRNELHTDHLTGDLPLSLQVDSSLEFFPDMSYSTGDKKVGIGTLHACVDQLNWVVRLDAAKYIPRALITTRLLAPRPRESHRDEVDDDRDASAWGAAQKNSRKLLKSVERNGKTASRWGKTAVYKTSVSLRDFLQAAHRNGERLVENNGRFLNPRPFWEKS